ncbi:MAG: type II secretion system major pseudopilin GspG, partial [Nitrospinaceae bacterium]
MAPSNFGARDKVGPIAPTASGGPGNAWRKQNSAFTRARWSAFAHRASAHFLPRSGFTLIELMVVMVIIGLLAALVVPKFFGHVDKALQQDAQVQIELLGQALDLYRLEKHKYPTTDDGLAAIASYLKKEVPKD